MTCETISKTRKGEREIISISLPLPLYERLQEVCSAGTMNRSAVISKAIEMFLEGLITDGV